MTIQPSSGAPASHRVLLASPALQFAISVIGVLDGAEISANVKPLLTKAPVIQGIAVGHRRGLEDLVRAVDMLGLQPVIARRYRPDAIREAFAHLDRGPFGKLVIEMD